MLRPDSAPRTFPLSREVTVIGRREDCDLRVPLSNVSRTHCKVVLDDVNGAVRVEDLGSSNGTIVNGHRVEVSALKAGDILALGPVKFVLQVDGEPNEAHAIQAATPAPAAAPAPAKKRQEKPDDFESEIDRILAGDSDDSGLDLDLDLDDKK